MKTYILVYNLILHSIYVIFAIPGNFPGMAYNFREFPIPGNENFVPESSSLSLRNPRKLQTDVEK